MEETYENTDMSEFVPNKSNTEFSDRMVSAYNKFMYVGSASVFISILDLDSTNTVFGFQVNELNERWLEFVFFLASFALAWNYLARVMDESRIFKELDNKVIEINNQLASNLRTIQNTVDSYSKPLTEYRNTMDFVKNVADNASLDRKAFNNAYHKFIDIRVKELKDNISSDASGGQGTMEQINRLNQEKNDETLFPMNSYLYGGALSEHLQMHLNALDPVADETKIISNKLEEIDLSISAKRKFFGWKKWRIISVDFLFPVVLLISVFTTFFYPNKVPSFMITIGECLDFRNFKILNSG